MTRSTPPIRVLAAFGVSDPQPVEGGRGTSWRAGHLVLKPDGHDEGSIWLAGLDRASELLRVSTPVRAADGAFVVSGWSATQFLEGASVSGAWVEIASVARTWATIYAGIPPAAWMSRRFDPWARADRIAWDESAAPTDLPQTLGRLLNARHGVTAPSTIIHGDLAGNVLFHPTLPPAVIDVSPYYRPAEYAVAIVAVDAVCFEGAPSDLPRTLVMGSDRDQLLVRATLFRTITDVLLTGSVDLARYEPILNQLPTRL